MEKEREFTCNYCGIVFRRRDKRARFCSMSCAAKNTNKNRVISPEQKEKTRQRLIDYWKKHPRKLKEISRRSQKGKHKKPKSILDVSKRTTSKICKRLKISCCRCGWNKAICDLHHIMPRNEGGSDCHSNLSYLCPNCHRLADLGKIPRKDLMTFEEYVKDTWMQHYYG